jgi:adenine nucleotide transporter 17
MLSYALYFLFYEKLKNRFTGGTIIKTIKVSAISGLLCSILVNPFWVLQTMTALSKTNETMMEAGLKLIQTDGFASLWKGLSSSLVLVSNPIIQYTAYEWLKTKFATGSSR